MRIAICTPIHGDAKAGFTESLANLISRTVRQRPDVEIKTIHIKSSNLPDSRNRLYLMAKQQGAEYILWADADHTFQDDALLRLLSRDLLMVGANYPRRGLPTGPTALRARGTGIVPVYTTEAAARAGEVEQVDAIGLGLCLMSMKVSEPLERLAEKAGKRELWPLFAVEVEEDAKINLTEDYYFCRLLTKAGVPIFVDHAVSWGVGHIYEVVLYNSHALAQREAWKKTLTPAGGGENVHSPKSPAGVE